MTMPWRLSLAAKLCIAMALVILAIALPGVLAERSREFVRRDSLRAGHASEALTEYLKLQAFGYEIEEKARQGLLTTPEARAAAHLRLDGHIRTIRNATRDELDIINSTGFGAEQKREMREEEANQRAYATIAKLSLSREIDGISDDGWKAVTGRAITSEEDEVRDAQVRSVRSFQRGQIAFLGSASAVTLAAVLALVWFRFQFFRPLKTLLDGTRRIAGGDYRTRLPQVGPEEFRAINYSFNAMADNIASSTKRLETSNVQLERAVSRRTAELEAANAALAHLNEMRRNFLADTSHELRTPLAVLISEADIALRKPDAPGAAAELRASLNRIVRTAEALRRLVDDLLQIARAEVPVLPFDRVATDLVVVVRDCVEEFAHLFAADGGAIFVEEAPGCLIARVDRARIAQVLRILVDNALKHSSNAPSVAFCVTEADGEAVIAVSDDGDGIAEADIPILLDRFRRRLPDGVHLAGSADVGWAARGLGEGMGLGLAIANTIVDVHGGSIAIASRKGVGTTVTIRLPHDILDERQIKETGTP